MFLKEDHNLNPGAPLFKIYLTLHPFADVAELVDVPDLGSGAARRGGSSPPIRTY